MKKIGLVLVTLLFSFYAASAQEITRGTFHRLIIPQDIDMQFDFTSGVYRGLTYNELVESECPGENPLQSWMIHEESLKNQFIRCFLEEVGPGYAFGSYANTATYRMTMKIINVTVKGYLSAIFTFTNISTGDIIVQFNVYGKGGKYGSFVNLFGDGIRDAGEVAGSFFIKQVKKCR